MSESVVIAIVAAVPATLAAFISYLNGKKSDKIHVLVNSNLTAVKADLVIANQRIAYLEDIITKRQ